MYSLKNAIKARHIVFDVNRRLIGSGLFDSPSSSVSNKVQLCKSPDLSIAVSSTGELPGSRL